MHVYVTIWTKKDPMSVWFFSIRHLIECAGTMISKTLIVVSKLRMLNAMNDVFAGNSHIWIESYKRKGCCSVGLRLVRGSRNSYLYGHIVHVH